MLADDPRPQGCKKLVSLDGWLNLLIDTCFAVEYMQEPHPSDETARAGAEDCLELEAPG